MDLLSYILAKKAGQGSSGSSNVGWTNELAYNIKAVFASLPEEIMVNLSNWRDDHGVLITANGCHLIKTEESYNYIYRGGFYGNYFDDNNGYSCDTNGELVVSINKKAGTISARIESKIIESDGSQWDFSMTCSINELTIRAYKGKPLKTPKVTLHFCTYNEWKALNPDAEYCEDIYVDFSEEGSESQDWTTVAGDTDTLISKAWSFGLWLRVNNGNAYKAPPKFDGTDETYDLGSFIPIIEDTDIYIYVSY